ncbi:MAG: hypothetical protein ACKVX7_05440 [Planctomycetota bacterium]
MALLHPDDTVELTLPIDPESPAYRAKVEYFSALVRQGALRCVVIPDWPNLPRWLEAVLTMLVRGARRLGFSSTPIPPRLAPGLKTLVLARSWGTPQVIYTIGAQCFGTVRLEALAIEAVRRGATGLLIVSGGAPARRIVSAILALIARVPLLRIVAPHLRRVLMPLDSVTLLAALARLKHSGALPHKLPLWAAANPYRDSVERTAQKIAAGAEQIVTQPPLLWETFHEWWRATQAHPQLTGRIRVGMAIPQQLPAFDFWAFLMGLSRRGRSPAERELKRVRVELQGDGANELTENLRAHGRDLLAKTRALADGVTLHHMPMQHWMRLVSTDLLRELAEELRAQLALAMQHRVVVAPRAIEGRAALESAYHVLVALHDLFRSGEIRTAAWRERCSRLLLISTISPNTFQPAVQRRAILDAVSHRVDWRAAPRFDVLLDVRQLGRLTYRARAEWLVNALNVDAPAAAETVVEDAVPLAASRVLWSFNREFWRRLDGFQNVLGVAFDAAIAGSPDTNPLFAAHLARDFLPALRAALHEESDGSRFYYVEIGTAGAVYVRHFLEQLLAQATATGLDAAQLRGRLVYVLADYSPQVIARARIEIGDHHLGVRVEHLTLSAEEGQSHLRERYAGRILWIHSTNVYDNLPGERLCRLNGRLYRIEKRTLLSHDRLRRIARETRIDASALAHIIERRLRQAGDVTSFLSDLSARFEVRGRPFDLYRLWLSFWQALEFEERLVEVEDLAAILAPTGASSAQFAAWLADAEGDVEMFLPSTAIASYRGLLALLHPRGACEIIDICVRSPAEYQADPRKALAMSYDGSLVYWFNAGLFVQLLALPGGPRIESRYEDLAEFGKPHMTRVVLRRPATSARAE